MAERKQEPAGSAARPRRRKARVAFQTPEVAGVFERQPAAVQSQLLRIRDLIFETAAKTPGVGQLEETLRWGDPSYLTTESGSGSMVRINKLPRRDDAYAVYFHCQTDLVERFRELYADHFEFQGNRAIVFEAGDAIPVHELQSCIGMALTYFQNRKQVKGGR